MKSTRNKPSSVSRNSDSRATLSSPQKKAQPYPFPSTFSNSFFEQVNKRFLKKAK